MKKYLIGAILVSFGILIAFPIVQLILLYDGPYFHPAVLRVLS